ncbi:LppC putative lipoprotein [hydrothermal vent metagenome]|uniref:LppC putative lipoprotein n=1 Tax=hydrothermal vent metagenome TaxID=652676 RepID=A0A3B1AYT9_9ZZZZ
MNTNYHIKKKLNRSILLPFIAIAIFLPSCSSTPSTGSNDDVNVIAAEQYIIDKQYVQAAKLFTNLAQQVTSPQYEEYMLRASSSLAKAGQTAQANQIIDSLDINQQYPKLMFYMQLAKSQIAMRERQVNLVLSLLDSPLSDVANHYVSDFYLLRARAHSMNSNRLATATELVKREPYLSNDKDIKANQQAIWQSLSALSERALHQLRISPPPDVLSGWMQLVEIAKKYQLRPSLLKEKIQQWRSNYQNHPLTPGLIAGLIARKAEDVAYPKHIALLLPLNGKFSKAAEAIRDGFMAAYYHNKTINNLTIRIYDSSIQTENILELYETAQKNGAEFIVGPLNKKFVTLLAQQDSLPIPTLALNYIAQTETTPKNLYQFGLSPEEEAIQIAERTWLDGYLSAAALVPAGPWGERVFLAFKERWEQLGGRITEYQTYNAALNDYTIPIRLLLNIDESRERYRAIRKLVKQNIKYTPRRRQDVDYIFLGAYPRQARQIRPQLKFFHAAKVPIYATSHIFTGNLNPEMDRDMDGIIFGDMPWVLSENSSNNSIRSEIDEYITNSGKQLQRLYALGIDAFNIIAAINPLKTYSYERYDGETGSLSIDEGNRVNRQLTWVRFRSGQPTLLDQELK